MASPTRRRVVVISFLVDLLDVATNLIVATITGSAVVFAEMAQGVADALGSAMLVIGDSRARRPRDSEHPLGYEREAFFWALLSAVAMLIVGAGLSAWRGYRQLVDPSELSESPLAIGVLVLAIGTNGYAVRLGIHNLTGGETSLTEAVRRVNRPLVKGAVFRDVIGTTTSIVGLVSLLLYAAFGRVEFDAVGALVAAALMTVGAFVLMAQSRELIAGRSLEPDELDRLRSIVIDTPGVDALNDIVAVHAGSERVLVELDLDLHEELDTIRIETLFDELEHRIRVAMPDVDSVRVDLNSPT